MQLFENQFLYVPLYLIKDCDNCYFISDKKIYNVDTKKISKLKVKNCSIGFNINGKFTLSKNIVKIKVSRFSKNL